MSPGWVAGSVRGRLLVTRRVGMGGARALAETGDPTAAVDLLARSAYGDRVVPGMPAEVARRAVRSLCLWHLRVLAGWLPPRGGDVVRVFAGRFELANIADRYASPGRVPAGEPYELGALAVAWTRVATAVTPQQVREALASSAWGDPGATGWPDAAVALEARWAIWLAAAVPDQPAWAVGRAALVAAQRMATGQPIPPGALVDLQRLLGRGWEAAPGLADLADRLPRAGAWVLDGGTEPADLWRAEGRWWTRVDRDSAAVLRAWRPGPAVAAASAARLAADSWWVAAALEAAGWPQAGQEAFDALA